MTDNPLVEAVADKMRLKIADESGFLVQRKTAYLIATAALRAIEDAGYRVVEKETPVT